MTVFVDTSAFISLWNKDDANYQPATQKSRQLKNKRATIFTSNMVVGEVLTVLSMKMGIKKANECGEYLQKLNILFVDENLHHKTWEVFKKRTSKNLSFIDYTSLIVCQEYKIDMAFSFDRDFKKLGIKVF